MPRELHQRRQSLGGVRLGRARSEESRQAVPLRLELLARQRAGRRRRVHRRGLQAGARRHDRRQVRPRRESRRRVRDDSPDGLPRSRRHLHGGDQQLAIAEDPAQAHRGDAGRPSAAAGNPGGVAESSGPRALGSGQRATRPRPRVRRQRRSPEDAGGHLRRRSRRRRHEFERADLRLHADRPPVRDARRQPHVLARRIAAVPVRPGGEVRPRARTGRLRLQRRDRTPRRSAGQRLDDRRRRESDRQVRSRRPHRARARPQTGDDRRPPSAAGEPAAGGGAARWTW